LKVLFEDLQRMRVLGWIVTLFDLNVQNADINSQLQDELPDIVCVWISKLNHFLNEKKLRESAM